MIKQIFAALAATLVFCAAAHAQSAYPNIAYCYPSGGQRGQTVKVLLGGKNFKDLEKVTISGSDVKIKINGEVFIPAQKNDNNALNRQLERLAGKKYGLTDENSTPEALNKAVKQARSDPEFAQLIKDSIIARNTYRIREFSTDALAETLELEISIDKNADFAPRVINIVTAAGSSNFVPFYIDDVAEVEKPSMRARVFEKLGDMSSGKTKLREITGEGDKIIIPSEPWTLPVTLPVICNGQINLKEADRYTFNAKKGERIVFAVQARALIPYIGDAVPGWFQASISVTDPNGDEIAYADDFHQYPDPIMAVTIPQNGKYTVEVKDAVYRGREDFVYRLLIGKVPFLTGIYPLGGQSGKPCSIELNGWNLPPQSIDFTPQEAGIFYIQIKNRGIFHNPIPFQTLNLEQVFESESNDTLKTANLLPFPAAADGRIAAEHDMDYYAVWLKAGQSVLAEVFARRLNSPIDAFLKVYDADGKIIFYNDDTEDPADGLTTHHADPRVEFKAPKDGTYYFSVEDTQGRFGKEYSYRLCIGSPGVNFELKAAPTAINLEAGKTATFKVYAVRRNSMKYPVELKVKGAPKGLTFSGLKIPADSSEVSVSISCPPDFENGEYPFEIEGTADFGGAKLTRKAIPCQDMLQAFYINHLVPSGSSLKIFVTDPLGKHSKIFAKSPFAETLRNLAGKSLELKSGGAAKLEISGIKSPYDTTIEFELVAPPAGMTLEKTETDKGITLTVKCTKEVTAGQSGNLVIELFFVTKSKKGDTRIKIDTLPAIPYTVK